MYMYTYIVICIYNAYTRLYIYVYIHAYIHHIYERGIITVGGGGSGLFLREQAL